MKEKLVILTGAGMSKESGIATFRDMGGMWEEYDVAEVATPEAWEKNQELVNRFYNERRKQLFEIKENEAINAKKVHNLDRILFGLEKQFQRL